MTPASCRLALVLTLDPARTAPCAEALDEALGAGDIACVLLRASGPDRALASFLEPLRAVAHGHDVALLLEDRIELAAAAGCDGVHLSAAEAVAAARQRLGADAIVGAGCGDSRHGAMVAGEAGADYVAFGRPAPDDVPAEAELLAWWQAVMTVPCLAFGAQTPAAAGAMARAGADFVAVERAVWDHPEGPAAGVGACATALDAPLDATRID